jgi:N-acetylglutamate synthase-like GNAT family acetyltransferase
MTTREEKIFTLTQNEIDWFLGNGEELNLVREVTEFFAKGGFNIYTDAEINDKYDRLTA